jgi:GR25 family glycosyltransferase involved in LPS biosynthesis
MSSHEELTVLDTDTFLKFEKTVSTSNIFISLTTIPPRFITQEFIKVVQSLVEQTLKPKNIIINLCSKYDRNFNVSENLITFQKDLIKKLFGTIIIFNTSSDYGPATKLLGLYDFNQFAFSPDDRIIVVDDDWEYHNIMTSYYETCYQLYNCDSVFVDERQMIEWNLNYFSHMKINKYKTLFFDNYQRGVFGWLSFSFKYKHVENLKKFFDDIILKHPSIRLHDDLLFTLFYRTHKLYACGISFLFSKVEKDRLVIDNYMALKNEHGNNFRFAIEQQLFDEYGLSYIMVYINPINNPRYLRNTTDNYNKLIFKVSSTKQRDFLTSVSNLKHIQKKEETFSNYSLHFNYVNRNMCILTVTFYDEPKTSIISFFNNDKICSINLNETYSSFAYKKSFIISGNFVKLNYHSDTPMFTTSKNNEISRKRFYSLLSFQTGISNRFEYFTYKDVENFIINNYKIPVYNLYKKLIPSACKADLFRALYILKNGGLYFDLKMILIDPNELNNIIDKNPITFVKDSVEGTCNALLWSAEPPKKYYKTYIANILNNVYTENYSDNFLNISGTLLLSKCENTLKILKYFCIDNNWQESIIYSKTTSNVIIKNAFPNYYNENYVNKNHDILYNTKQMFNKTLTHYNNVNGIGHILWINLERVQHRRDYMKSILSTLNIPNTRIDAIDGKIFDISEYKKYNTHITNFEIATTLSHIKTNNIAKKIFDNPEFKSDYIMVCEDDISFEGTILAMKNLEDIIKDAPEFDILQIHKMFFHEIPDVYSKWSDLSKPGDCVVGASCYIISRKGANHFVNNVATYQEPNKFSLIKTNFHVADYYTYANTNTIVYKYNFLNTLNNDSCIHPDHIDYHKKATLFQLTEIFKNLV